jgi:predicted  nucleic acid-binding Zn-ribbon protein
MTKSARFRAIVGGLFVAAMIFAMLSPGAKAYPPVYSVRASQGTTDNEDAARVAAGPNGEIYVAYYRNTGPVGNLYLAVDRNGLYPEGAPVFTAHNLVNDGGAFVLDDFTTYHTVPVLVAPNGDVYIAWSDERNSATTGQDIRIARSTDSGATFGLSSRVSTTAGTNNEQDVEIAMGPNGEIYATWMDNTAGTYDVYFAASSDNGATWTPSYRVNTATTLVQIFPSIACDSRGAVYISWFDQNTQTVQMDSTRDGGTTWLGNTKLPKTTHAVIFSSLYVDVQDTVHAAFQDNNNGGIYYARSFDHGVTFEMEKRLDDTAYMTLTKPVIVANDLGEVYVAWHIQPPGPTFELRVVGSPNWGSAFTKPLPISADQGIMPTLAVGPDNTLFAGYSYDDGGPNGYEAYAIWVDRPTDPVKNLIATPLPVPGGIKLGWNANTEKDLANYMVWDMTYDPQAPALVATVPPSQTSFDLLGLANGEYTYAVTTTTIAGYASTPTYVRFTVGPTVADMIAALQAQIAALQDAMNGMNTTLQSRMDQLDTSILNVQTEITNLQTQLATVETDLQTQLTDVQNQLTNVETNLQTRIDQLQNDITSLMSQVTTIQLDIGNLQNQVTILQTSVSSLQSQVNLMMTFVDGMNATIQANINTLQTNINAMQTQITSLQTGITSLQTTLTSVQTTINDMNTALSDDIAALGDDVGSVKDKMATKDDLASAQSLLMMLLIVVLIVSILSMVMSMRKPKMKAPEPTAAPPQAPPQQYPPQQPPYGSP